MSSSIFSVPDLSSGKIEEEFFVGGKVCRLVLNCKGTGEYAHLYSFPRSLVVSDCATGVIDQIFCNDTSWSDCEFDLIITMGEKFSIVPISGVTANKTAPFFVYMALEMLNEKSKICSKDELRQMIASLGDVLLHDELLNGRDFSIFEKLKFRFDIAVMSKRVRTVMKKVREYISLCDTLTKKKFEGLDQWNFENQDVQNYLAYMVGIVQSVIRELFPEKSSEHSVILASVMSAVISVKFGKLRMTNLFLMTINTSVSNHRVNFGKKSCVAGEFLFLSMDIRRCYELKELGKSDYLEFINRSKDWYPKGLVELDLCQS